MRKTFNMCVAFRYALAFGIVFFTVLIAGMADMLYGYVLIGWIFELIAGIILTLPVVFLAGLSIWGFFVCLGKVRIEDKKITYSIFGKVFREHNIEDFSTMFIRRSDPFSREKAIVLSKVELSPRLCAFDCFTSKSHDVIVLKYDAEAAQYLAAYLYKELNLG